jgi:high-affinity nickel-transport protein
VSDPLTGSTLSAVALGLLLGVQHATDADHVVAVATIVSRTRRFGAGALIGAFWGLGHTLTIAAVGAAIILFRVTVTPTAGLAMEFAVAIMLVILGVARLSLALRGARTVAPEHLAEPHRHDAAPAFHSHAHAHGEIVHRHPHVHPPTRLAAALNGVGIGQAIRSTSIGVVHGLAGSAAVALLAVSTIADPYLAVGYLLVFGAGTIAGMTAITGLMALPFVVGAGWLARCQGALAMGTGALSLAFGLYLGFHIGFVDGLFR